MRSGLLEMLQAPSPGPFRPCCRTEGGGSQPLEGWLFRRARSLMSQPLRFGEAMSSIVQIFRFVVGLGLVVAGGFLAAPFVSAVVQSVDQGGGSPEAGAHGAGGHHWQRGQSDAVGVYAVPGMEQSTPLSTVEPLQPSSPPRSIPLAGTVQALPTATAAARPERLPQTPRPTRPPDLTTAYRSTVEMPPPPLLDAATPAPARLAVMPQSLAAAPLRQMPASLPEQYRVQDGDDLTGIATRLYGHPRGASALWRANADRLERPDLLPIGLSLDVPPAWAVFADAQGEAGRGQQIEPAGIVPVGAVSSQMQPLEPGAASREASPRQPSGPTPWLGQPPALRPLPPRSPKQVASRGSLRVTAGETLGSIAQRVYGDGGMAAAIFAANRDQLRSPDLLVPGMELRLP